MKLLRIVAVVSLTAFGGITGGTCIVHATLATGVLYRQGPEKNPVRNTVRCSGCRIPMSTRPKPTVENQRSIEVQASIDK